MLLDRTHAGAPHVWLICRNLDETQLWRRAHKTTCSHKVVLVQFQAVKESDVTRVIRWGNRDSRFTVSFQEILELTIINYMAFGPSYSPAGKASCEKILGEEL